MPKAIIQPGTLNCPVVNHFARLVVQPDPVGECRLLLGIPLAFESPYMMTIQGVSGFFKYTSIPAGMRIVAFGYPVMGTLEPRWTL